MMKFKGHDVFIDDRDRHFLNSHNWYIHTAGVKKYLRGYLKGRRSTGLVYLHRLILTEAKEVDHIDRDGLNNRRSNLRECTRSLNNGNKKDSGSKGVYFDKENKKYAAEVRYKGVRYRLGRFKTFVDAKTAYNNKAKELFGDFANVAEVTNDSFK